MEVEEEGREDGGVMESAPQLSLHDNAYLYSQEEKCKSPPFGGVKLP